MFYNLSLILVYIACVSTAQVSLKVGLNSIGTVGSIYFLLLRSIQNVYVLLGIVLYGISFLVWLVVLSKMEITFAYPLLSLSVIVVSVISWVFFNETFNITRLIGIVITVSGCYLVVRS